MRLINRITKPPTRLEANLLRVACENIDSKAISNKTTIIIDASTAKTGANPKAIATPNVMKEKYTGTSSTNSVIIVAKAEAKGTFWVLLKR
jgi:hypothetical protein